MNKHMLMSGFLTLNPSDKPVLKAQKLIEDWLTELVSIIDMKVLMPARAIYCTNPGNEGMTGDVVIDTSHAAIHIWDKDDSFKFDLYSCKDFDTTKVIQHFKSFVLIDYTYVVIDRDNFDVLELDRFAHDELNEIEEPESGAGN